MPFLENIQLIERIGDNHVNLRFLREQLNSSIGVVPFVGAGLPMSIGFPGWKDFIVLEANKVGLNEVVKKLMKEGKIEEAAEVLLQARGQRAFNDAIIDQFGDHNLKERELRGSLLYIPLLAKGPVITTNFDHILEKVFRDAGKPFEDVIWGAMPDVTNEALHQNRRYLLKMHGDVRDRRDRVITLSDYHNHYGGISPDKINYNLPLPRLLGRIMSARPLLFVGCSLEQDRTITVLSRLASKNPEIAHYAIVEEPDKVMYRQKATCLSQMGIRPIWFPQYQYKLVESILAFLVNKPTVLEILGLRFILITGEATSSIYIAETPVCEQQWVSIMEDSNVSAFKNSFIAKVNISITEVQKFIERSNKQIESLHELRKLQCTARLRIPPRQMLIQIIGRSRELDIPPRNRLNQPCLSSPKSSSESLRDLLGVVYQFCHNEKGEYGIIGGSFKTPKEDFEEAKIPYQPWPGTMRRSPVCGFRPMLVLNHL